MRKSAKIALGALIAGVALFVADLPFGKQGWEKTVGGALFVLSVLAVGTAVIASIYTVATRTRSITK